MRLTDEQLADVRARVVDTPDEEEVQALVDEVRLLRALLGQIHPNELPCVSKIRRDEFPSLFGPDDGNALYLDEAAYRALTGTSELYPRRPYGVKP